METTLIKAQTRILRGYQTNSTQSAFGGITPGIKTLTRSGLTLIYNDGTLLYPIIDMQSFRGAKLWFFGAGSAGNTGGYRIWSVNYLGANGDSLLTDDTGSAVAAEFVGYIADTSTITLGTQTGISNNPIITNTDLLATSLTATLATGITTPAGPATDEETAWGLGVMTAHSPGSNKTARLLCPNMRGNAFCIEFVNTSTTNLNFAYQLTA